MTQNPDRVLVTGANGHLGRKLIDEFSSGRAGLVARAFVRSERAERALRSELPGRDLDVVVGDYADVGALTQAMHGCRRVVHLVGIIKESATASYESAHEATCGPLGQAAARAGVERIVYLSIVGARAGHTNRCLASKGRAEDILLAGSVPATVLRVPMVIGEDDFAAAALRRQALSKHVMLTGGGRTRQQPIDALDVLRAVVAAFDRSGPGGLALDLGGPENLSHRELVARAARVLGRPAPRVWPIPTALARAAAGLAYRLLANPPITPDMLEILEHDDEVDASVACELLGLELTPLDATLARCLAAPEHP